MRQRKPLTTPHYADNNIQEAFAANLMEKNFADIIACVF